VEAEQARAETGQAKAEAEQGLRQAEADKLQIARDTRLSTAETLNQALRRIRQSASSGDALATLVECTAPYAQQAVVLRVENHQLHSVNARGVDNIQISFPLEAAPAVANLCETREPIVALVSDGELSAELAAAFASDEPSRKAYLFAVAARQEVIAVLAAAGEPSPAALELLSEAAGMKLEALQSEIAPSLKPLPSADLVQIAAPSVPETPTAERRAWSDLSPEDQKLHLQAQRVVRVKVAEMRLYHAEALRKGVFDGNIYNALQPEIDLARADFLQNFLSKSRTMVDYLHLEILRSLAHEDDRLLGHDYPGPMV
jgi:hypothetical protein